MPRPKEDRKQEVIAAIREHLMVEGPQKWETLQTKYPDVPRSTLFRWIKEVREDAEEAAGKHGAGALRLAQKRIRKHVEPVAKTQERIKAHLPAAPSPAVIAGEDAHVEQMFDFFAYFGRIVSDAELVRAEAVRKNEDGTEKAKNPVLLDNNLRRRLGILETYLHAMHEVYNLEKIQQLYRIVIDAVGEADPEIQRAILVKLREADNVHGLTMNARLR
jgi:hypothetical protein